MIIDKPLSVRNNNPGNIRKGAGFAVYDTPQAGLDALRNDLTVKVSGNSRAMKGNYGDDYTPTIRNLISTYAPNNENDTDAYITAVAQNTGIDPDAALAPADVDKLIPAIIHQEGGSEATSHFTPSTPATADTSDALDFSNDAEPLDFSAEAAIEDTAKPEIKPAAKDNGFWENLKDAAAAGVRQFNQGSTFGFADELLDPAAAAAASAVTGVPFKDLYADARDDTRRDNKSDFQNHPIISTGANLGGSILTTAAGGAGLNALGGKVAPGMLEAVTNAARTSPKIAASLIGAGGGALYGAGSADGADESRLGHAALGAVGGGMLGVPGYYAAKGASGLVNAAIDSPLGAAGSYVYKGGRNLLNAAGEKLGLKTGGMLDNVSAAPIADDLIAPAVAAQAAPEITPMSLAGINEDTIGIPDQTNIFSLTKGERTGDVKLQRQEEMARKYGSPKMRDLDEIRMQQARENFGGILGPDQEFQQATLGQRVSDEAGNIASILRSKDDRMKTAVSAAYKEADDLGSNFDVNTLGTLQNGLEKVYSDNLDPFGVGMKGQFPAYEDAVSQLQTIQDKIKNGGVTHATITALEDWKKNVLNRIDPLKAPINAGGAKNILGQANGAYEDFLDGLVENSLIRGDQGAIDAFRKARGLASERFKYYDSLEGYQDIIDNRDLTGSDLANLFGANNLGRISKQGGAQKLIDAAGDRGPEMMQAMKRGMAAMMMKAAATGVRSAVSPENDTVAFVALQNKIGKILENQDFMKTVYSPGEQQALRQGYNDLRAMKLQPGAKNPSGTGTVVGDLTTGLANIINNPLVKLLPGPNLGGNLVDSGAQQIAAKQLIGKVEKNNLDEFDNIIKNAVNNLDTRPVFYGSISANALANATPPFIVVHPSRKKEKK